MAINVVNNVVESSEFIINTLKSMEVDFKQIAAVAPKLQQTFRDYLDADNESGLVFINLFFSRLWEFFHKLRAYILWDNSNNNYHTMG